MIGLIDQVLRLCQKAGMVSLGHVVLFGTKVEAKASKHKVKPSASATAKPSR